MLDQCYLVALDESSLMITFTETLLSVVIESRSVA